jgi:hypothetical protein
MLAIVVGLLALVGGAAVLFKPKQESPEAA